jgi:uncharacterized protein YacL
MAWLAFWLGVVLALVAWAVFSLKIGLLVFAVGLVLTIVLIVAGVRTGARKAAKFGRDLQEEGRRYRDEHPPVGTHDAGRNIVTDTDAENGWTSGPRDRNIR